MSKETLVPIKKATITNNCPECFNNNLSLTFYQKQTEGAFFKKLSKEVTNKVKCNTCYSTIYPVNWTEDIERVVEYYKKAVKPKKASLRATSQFYIFFFTLIAIGIALFAYLRYTEII